MADSQGNMRSIARFDISFPLSKDKVSNILIIIKTFDDQAARVGSTRCEREPQKRDQRDPCKPILARACEIGEIGKEPFAYIVKMNVLHTEPQRVFHQEGI